MIGLIGAMQPEVEDLIARLEDPVREEIGGTVYFGGRLEGKNVLIARCGIGKVCAAACAQTMIVHFGADRIINTGVAGALDPALSIGDVVAADALVQHDMDTTALGDPPGLISALGEVTMPTDETLWVAAEQAARECGVTVRRGIIATSDRFVCQREDKENIRRAFGAVCCEMEGGAVAQVCRMNGVPFAVLRAVSDTADERSVVDYPTFMRSAAATMATVVRRSLARLP
ncbi:MAG: 5'-methylthioadenosine/adenosylhomocysteine nucleosidase [Clostridia bacterium]|nr:5'-methylthioadenosine/adenosylhomocysteine nucleosidase [Clostridia bacterium]